MPGTSEYPIEISTDERVFLTGKTDSGKTYAARYFLEDVERLVVLDPKVSDSIRKWRLAPWDKDAQRALMNGKPVRARVIFPITEDPENFWNEILFHCWNAGNVTIYIDEVYLLKPEGGGFPRYLSLAYTTGRERGVGTWASSQRPAFVPMVLMSEAEHVFGFRLNREDDRITLAKNTHPAMGQEIPSADPNGFRYWNVHQDAPIYLPRLDTEHGAGWGVPENTLIPEEIEDGA
jgi:hypothetical protein